MPLLRIALLMVACVSEVAAVRPRDLTEGAELRAQEKPAALLQTGDPDPDEAKEDFKKVFLEVQTIGATGTILATIDKATGLFADDGVWMKELATVEQIWSAVGRESHISYYNQDKLSSGYEERAKEIHRGLYELRGMVDVWKAVLRQVISMRAPVLSSDMEDMSDDYLGQLRAYNYDHQTILIAFMKAFSLDQLESDVRSANYAVKELIKHKTGKTITTAGFIANSFLPALYLLSKNIPTFMELVKGFQESSHLGVTEFATSKEMVLAELHLRTLLDLPGFANRALMRYAEDLTAHCEIPDKMVHDQQHLLIMHSLESGGLSSNGRDPANNFEIYMDGILYMEGPKRAMDKYTEVAESALGVIPKTDPPVFLFRRFTVPSDWNTRYAL